MLDLGKSYSVRDQWQTDHEGREEIFEILQMIISIELAKIYIKTDPDMWVLLTLVNGRSSSVMRNSLEDV